MIRRPQLREAVGLALLASTLSALGCGRPADPPPIFPVDAESGTELGAGNEESLETVIKLIRTAPTNPGGENFTLAAENLNDYFRGTDPVAFVLPAPLREFLEAQSLPPDAPAMIRNPRFQGVFDGRHIEDCLLYRGVADGILERTGAETADDLTRAREVFKWVVRQVQLVPPGALAPPGFVDAEGVPFQPPARPYDVLVRGMATEIQGDWAERSWLFLALCRQLKIDAGMLLVVPASESDGSAGSSDSEGDAMARDAVKPLGVGVLVDGKVYLFDAGYGMEVPGPGGVGVTTLEQAATDPAILDALDLPDEPYPIDAADLEGGRVLVFLEATLGSLATRMKLLQEQLYGANRMVLYRDPSEQADLFRAALGDRLQDVRLWPLPMEVEYALFHDGRFTQATGYSIGMFDPKWPLLPARLSQLRGELDLALEQYVSFLNVPDLLESDGKTPISPEALEVMNLYATHFIGLAHLDAGRDSQAKNQLEQTLEKFALPAQGRPFYLMFRWGAQANLARIAEDEGSPRPRRSLPSDARPHVAGEGQSTPCPAA